MAITTSAVAGLLVGGFVAGTNRERVQQPISQVIERSTAESTPMRFVQP